MCGIRNIICSITLLCLLPSTVSSRQTEHEQEPKLEYYGEIGCAHCDLFAEKILPAAEQAVGIEAVAEYFDILSEEGYERCESRLGEMGYSFSIFPVLVIGNNVYQGNSSVEEGLPVELEYFATHGTYLSRTAACPSEPPASSDPSDSSKFPIAGDSSGPAGPRLKPAVLPVLLAGIIDGVNPCAFATMLFFLSWIFLKGGTRRRMLLAGSGFIAGIFLAYLAIGFGLFSLLRTAGKLALTRQVMRYLFSLMAMVFALLSLYDAVLFRRRGQGAPVLLKLPPVLSKHIHGAVRRSSYAGEGIELMLVPTLAVTGALVALLELACTGQIYFPTIAYMVQSGQGQNQVLWLLLYNFAFILPLTALFTAVLSGVAQQQIREWFSRNLAAGKIAAALLFALLAVIIWVSG